MPWLIRIHGGIALCALILGTTTTLWSLNAHPQETSGDHTVAPVQRSAGCPKSHANSPQQSRSKAGAHPDNAAVNPAGGQNAIPQSRAEPPTSPQWPQSSAPGDGGARKLQPAVGTAVAPEPAALPIAAAEPNVRKIVVKVGALVAAGAAPTTVLILTETTASKPAVAH